MLAITEAGQCIPVYLRIAQNRINFLRFILEGYDGLAIASTIESNAGLVRILVPSCRYNELINMLQAIAVDLG